MIKDGRLKAFDFQKWIDDNKRQLKPPAATSRFGRTRG